jgi:hypothetical protein
MAPFPGAAGVVAALIGAIGFTTGAFVSAMLGAAFDGTARPMASVAALAGAGAFVLERITRHGKA